MVSAVIVQNKHGKNPNHSFMGEMSIKIIKDVVVVTPDVIIINSNITKWKPHGHTIVKTKKLRIKTSENGNILHITTKKTGPIIHISRTSSKEFQFLNIFMTHVQAFSKQATGILGKQLTL